MKMKDLLHFHSFGKTENNWSKIIAFVSKTLYKTFVPLTTAPATAIHCQAALIVSKSFLRIKISSKCLSYDHACSRTHSIPAVF